MMIKRSDKSASNDDKKKTSDSNATNRCIKQ